MTKRKGVPTDYLESGPEVNREGARTIIEAVMSTPTGRAFTRPNDEQLVIDIKALQDEFLSRKTVDSMLSLSELSACYNKFQKAANGLENALRGVTESWSAHYFFVDAQEEELEREFSVEEAGHAMLDHLVRRAAVALRAVDAARGSDNADRWYELAEGAAPAWLFDYGLPQLFRKTFNSVYAFSDGSQSPGRRFAMTLLPLAGLPLRASDTFRGRLKKLGKEGVDGGQG